MRKRIIALLLALILTVGLLPTVALAAKDQGTVEEPTQTVQTTSSVEHEKADDPIHIKKSVSEDGNTLTMEAYVTNPLEIKQEAVPLDIVLVLDVSGSMDETFKSSTVAKYGTYYKWTTNEQYAKYDNLYYGAGTPKSKVSVTTEAVYTLVDSLTYDDIYEDADYSGRTSYYAKGSDGTYHRLGLDWENKGWSRNYYITVDGQREAQINDWDAQVRLNGYESLYQYETKYTYKNADTGDVILTSVGADSRPQLNGTTAEFYYYNGDGQQKEKKIDALKAAVKSFIENVNAQELPKGKAHRISIVTFASEAETKAGLTVVNDTNAAALKKTVDDLHAGGATQADKGMSMAAGILTGRDTADKTRPSVVIMFTDGVPTSWSEFEDAVAAGAINNAKSLKDGGTTVYTIAVANGANPADTPSGNTIDKNINWYLNAVSSNYPNASATETGSGWSKTWTFNYDTRVSLEKDYYFTATDAQGLSMVFDTISREVSNLALIVDSDAVLSDTLSGFFTFDGVDAATKTGITVKEVPVKGTDANGNFTWDTDKATDIANNNNVKIAVNDKSITVKGFDYGKHAVTKHQDGKVTGSKLVITFPIKPDDNATWEEGRHAYPTNDTTTSPAGLTKYALKSAPDAKDQDTLLTQSPTLAIEAHKVTYVVEANDYTGTYTTPPEKVYREGVQYTIEATPTLDSGYKFTGWKDNDKYTSADVAGSKPMGNTSVTYYGKIEKNEVEVDLANYVKKTLTATSLPEGFSETFNATIKNKTTNEEKALKVTFGKDEAGQTKNFIAADGVTTTVSLTAGTIYSYTVTETAGTNNSITYGTIPQDFALKVNDDLSVTFGKLNEGTFEADSAGCVTIENKYTPGETSFSLAQKFQKVLESNTADVPRKSFKLTITGTTDNTGKTTISGTADIGTLTKQNDKYTGSANFAFANSLNFSTAGIYKYKVQETGGSTAGMTYDTTEYELVIEVENNNGVLEIKSATIGSTDMKDHGPLTITNTFTAAELPLNPDPTTGTGKIIKKLKFTGGTEKTKEEMKFTVTVKDADGAKVAEGEATVPADSTDGVEVPFIDLGTLVFTTADEYSYTIKETKGSISGVTYDEKEYKLKVVVRKSDTDNSLIVESASFSYNNGTVEASGNFLDDPITITNIYTEPKDPSVVSKKVVTTDQFEQLLDGQKNDIYEFESAQKTTVLYPTGNGTTNNTLEVPYGTNSVTLLYAITVSRGTESDKMDFVDEDATFVFAVGAAVSQNESTDKFEVTFNDGVSTAVIYVAKTHGLNFTDDTCKVDNTVLGQKAETTVIEKDPNSVTVDFSQYIYKKLTVTGDKAFTGATFEAVLDGEWHDLPTALSLEDASAIATYAHATPGAAQLHKTLTVSFDANDDLTQNKAFTGSITFNAEGVYTYTLKEIIPEGATGYDTSEFLIQLWIKANNDAKLEVKSVKIWYNNKWEDLNGIILFENTIDTGKDDYYPIIIPTIIGKDTGMLNKTDHFAYVIGYPDGTVHPNGQITRAEVATIFFRLLRDKVRDGAFTTSNSYSDVAYGKWYNNPISTMSALGIITGYPDGTFKPNKPITRAEFAAIAARFDETQSGKSATFSDVIGHWAAKEIGIAYYNDWIKGYPDGTFKPDQNITRAEAMTLINRVLERKPESPADLLTNMNKWTDNMDTSKWYYLDVQEATNSHGYTRKTFNYELWRQMLNDPDWSRYER